MRWQARHLVRCMEHDLGLWFRGYFVEADERWDQPVSKFADENGKRPEPIRNLLTFPRQPDDMKWAFGASDPDVVLIGDIGNRDSAPLNWSSISQYVFEGGGLVILAGQAMLGLVNDAEFRAISPVVPDSRPPADRDSTPILYCAPTPEGARHSLMAMHETEAGNALLLGSEESDGFKPGALESIEWVAPVARLNTNATVLARATAQGGKISEGVPLVVVREVGRGRVVWIGSDDFWKWRQYIGDIYFYQLFQNAIRWAAMDPGPG